MTNPSPGNSSAGPNALDDSLLTVRTDQGKRATGIASLIALLLSGRTRVISFPELAAEQRGYWWRFLIRCAAKALHDSNRTADAVAGSGMDDLATEISAILADASGGRINWMLHQPDPDIPAFLQPPTPDGSPPDGGYKEHSAAFLTTALGSKNHERKSEQQRVLSTEQAVYALVEFQFGAIFGGRGNYASQLMGSASGTGSGVPFMAVRLSDDLCDAFRHDVTTVLERWDGVRDRGVGGGLWALWTDPWDGERSLPAKELDPAFIPLARMVRLDRSDEHGRFGTVWFRPSKAARVNDHTGGGTLGDIFTPFVYDERKGIRKVRGTLPRGYDYREMIRLLFRIDGGEPSHTVAALIEDTNAPDTAHLVFEGTAFDQGKTEGFHSRVVPIPVRRVRAFSSNPEPLHQAHRFMLEAAAEAKTILRGAARILLFGDLKPRTGDRDKIDVGARALEHTIDNNYLSALLAAADRHANGDRSYEEEWKNTLATWARDAFEQTRACIPVPVGQRYRREVGAEDYLWARLRRIGAGETQTVDTGEAA